MTVETIEDAEDNDGGPSMHRRESVSTEHVRHEPIQEDKIPSSIQADELERSLNRIRHDPLSKATLLISKGPRFRCCLIAI